MPYSLQKAGVNNVASVKIGTTLPHSEVNFWFNAGDPQPFFAQASTQTDWSSFSGLQKNLVTWAVAPPITQNPSDLNTWDDAVAAVAGVALAQTHSGVWRMDHGACSFELPTSAIIATAESAIKNQGVVPFNVTFNRAEGLGYVSHPSTSLPWADNSGGIMINTSGSAKGSDLANAFSGLTATLLLAIAGPLAAVVEWKVQDVNFASTVAVNVDVNGQGLIQGNIANKVTTVSDAGPCGLSWSGGFLNLPSVNICLSGNVQSSVDSQVASKVNDKLSALSTALTVPMPKITTQLPPPVCPSFASCQSAQDCLNDLGVTYSNDFSLPLVGVQKAGVGVNLSTGELTGVNADRTITGLQSDNSGTTTDVWAQAKAQLTTLSNWSCQAVDQVALASIGKANPFGECPIPAGNVCHYKMKAKRANHYANSLEIVWYDELDKVVYNAQNIASLPLGSLVSNLVSFVGMANPLCTVDPTHTNFFRAGSDVVKTSGF
jgi:hypothetical protein